MNLVNEQIKTNLLLRKCLLTSLKVPNVRQVQYLLLSHLFAAVFTSVYFIIHTYMHKYIQYINTDLSTQICVKEILHC